MSYVVLVHATFENLGDANHIYNQAKSVATTASVAKIGEAGERSSYAGVYEELLDGTLEQIVQWHIDRFGIVRTTPAIPNDIVPDWIQPTGIQDAYPLIDVFGSPTKVKHLGEEWINTVENNTQPPGIYGWLNANEPEEEEPVDPPAGDYPAWKPWTSGLNEDLYQVGDEVSHNGANWRSTANNNYWEPGVYGWVAL